MKYNIELQPSGVCFESDSVLLDDAISQDVVLEHSCKTGACGACSAQVISGKVENESGEIVEQGGVLTCKSRAASDVILKANYYPELAHIEQKNLPCKVMSIKLVCDNIIVLKLRLPPSADFRYLPGQYIDLSYKGLKRSYSIGNAKTNANVLELHIRKVPDGKMSALLFEHVENEQLMRFEGPKGTFFLRSNEKPIIMLATGTGIASIKALVEQMSRDGDDRKVHVYWGMRFAYELYCDELRELIDRNSNIEFTPVLSRDSEWSGAKGYVQDTVCKQFSTLEGFDVYACGSIDMINDARVKFKHKSLLSDAFYSDAFTSAE